MLTEYEATALTKERLRAAQQTSRTSGPDEQMSIGQIEKRMRQAHELRSKYLRDLLIRKHSSKRVSVAMLLLCLLSAVSLFFVAGSRRTVDAKTASQLTPPSSSLRAEADDRE